ncbi:ABC transporter permease [Actinomyces sp. B33]|uniref:ABC transporter permease n=1 Tax=Actinomyces sp. B33 TaxID=2942131 RepID=UPI00234072DB|nr:ABC transporter permease [Actinomyces sp. B33]MDC4233611.1 ABC transporter permease [Actinomyces sp. B33]
MSNTLVGNSNEELPEGAPSRGARKLSFSGVNLPPYVGALGALILLCIVLSIVSPSFLTVANIFNIGQQSAILAVIAIGGTAVIIVGGIDLSVGSILALAGAVVGVFHIGLGWDVWSASFLGLVVGAAAGAVNGILIVLGRLPAFIATLAMMSVARGLSLVVLDGRPLSGYPESFRALTTHYVAGWLPTSVVVAAVCLLIAGFYFRFAPSGRSLFAMGANLEVSRLSGVPTGRLMIGVYTVAGILAAVGGIMMTSRLGSAQPTAGTGIELDVIAAVVIGGASLSGGYGSIVGTAVGVLMIGVLRNGLNLLNVSSFWQQVVIGVVIALAVLVEQFRQRRVLSAP